jgi:hypothetical protein
MKELFSACGCRILPLIFLTALTNLGALGQAVDKHPPTQTPLQQELAKFDKDQSGKIDGEEQAAYLTAQQKKRNGDLKMWDKIGDGELDETERAQARALAKQSAANARRVQKEAKAKENAAASPAKP